MADPDIPNDEARETLAQLEQRLRRDVGDMVTVLVADVPMFFSRAVRRAFERSPQADAFDDAKVAELKADTARASEALAAKIEERLSPFDAWLASAAKIDPGAEDLRGQPQVDEVLSGVGEELEGLLAAHGLSADVLGEERSYRLPSYFVRGHFMKSLVANYWRALADFVALQRRIEEESQADERERRRARWDGV